MSLIIDIIKIPTQLDGRRKISDEQKQHVLRLYHFEGKGLREITRLVGISRRSVQFILFPERLAVVKARAIEVKRWEKGNKKEYHTPAMQKYRAKKKDLLAKGLVKIMPEDLTKYQSKLKERNQINKIKRTNKQTHESNTTGAI